MAPEANHIFKSSPLLFFTGERKPTKSDKLPEHEFVKYLHDLDRLLALFSRTTIARVLDVDKSHFCNKVAGVYNTTRRDLDNFYRKASWVLERLDADVPRVFIQDELERYTGRDAPMGVIGDLQAMKAKILALEIKVAKLEKQSQCNEEFGKRLLLKSVPLMEFVPR